MDNPAIMNPAKTRDGEDHRVDWLTFSNINQWTDAAKKELIDLGMVKDEPGYISKFVLYLLCPFFCIYVLTHFTSPHFNSPL